MNKPHNIYIHVPFCASKCNYCAFYSRPCAAPDWTGYCDGILAEIEWGYELLGRVDIPTIFFGGGTPSLMPSDIFQKIMERVRNRFNVLPDCEVSLESNPGTLDAQKLTDFKSFGLNRLSVGVQSLNDTELKFLGRRHDAAQAVRLLNNARDMGLMTSADFIYGLPGQDANAVAHLCNQINDLGLSHCSVYELSIEAGTPFAKMGLTMPNNDTMADMYQTIDRTLALPRYEVSNYATPGQECCHNQNIWNGDPYIGFGRAACGRPLVNNTWYEQEGNSAKFAPIDTSARAIEKLITGLRLIRGIDMTDDIINVIDFNFVQSHMDLLTMNDGRLIATSSGILVLDDLLVKLIK